MSQHALKAYQLLQIDSLEQRLFLLKNCQALRRLHHLHAALREGLDERILHGARGFYDGVKLGLEAGEILDVVGRGLAYHFEEDGFQRADERLDLRTRNVDSFVFYVARDGLFVDVGLLV